MDVRPNAQSERLLITAFAMTFDPKSGYSPEFPAKDKIASVPRYNIHLQYVSSKSCSETICLAIILNSEVEARFKEENADGRGCSLTHADEFGQCANIDEEIRMLFSVPMLKQAPMA